ncbi:MAG: YbhB/YbcL family Raf kinase inhibitor-like protein [Caulobacteraceae bacterium]
MNRQPLLRLALASALAGCCGLAAASSAEAGGTVAFDRPELQAPASIKVTVSDIAPDGAMSAKFTADGKNVAPSTRWSVGPPGTKSYVLIMQDPDASGPEPIVHWLVYDIPIRYLAVPGGMRNMAEPANPFGSAQGWNYHGSVGYTGPRLAVSDGLHHYHFQVFALDRALHVAPGAQPERVLGAMKGHVIARGELVATYAAPKPKEPRSQGATPQGPTPPETGTQP